MLLLIDDIGKAPAHQADVARAFDVLIFVCAFQLNTCTDPVRPASAAQRDLDVIHSYL